MIGSLTWRPAGGGRRRAPSGLWLLLLAAPGTLFLGGVFVYPVLRLLALGAGDGRFLPYARVLHWGGPFLTVLSITLRISLATGVLCLLLGYPVAYFLATGSRRERTLGFVFVLLPFWTSLLVRTYAWIALLGNNGAINRTLLDLGIIDQPLRLLYGFSGVLIGMVHVLLPYMVFPIYASLVRMDPNVVLAAEGLGAGRAALFWRIYVPLTKNGIFAGSALVFTLSLGAFVTPALLGGGRIVMIANVIQQEVSQFLDWPLAGALAGILLLAALAIYGGVSRSLRGTGEFRGS